MERTVLHSDMNNFFASVECLSRPEIRFKPVIVCGKTEDRHGIVLAKNNVAKRLGVSTGEPIKQADKKCGGAVKINPDFDKYVLYSKIAGEIYNEYTDQVESFGIDECWLEISGGSKFGEAAANDIRRRIKKETGLTVSIGVSFTKTFAKLCSDLKKPDAVTSVRRSDFREKIWPLPCNALLGVGDVTNRKLNSLYIHTIGDLAQSQPSFLSSRLGKNGKQLWAYANGYDTSPISYFGESIPLKSISNGMTIGNDLYANEQIRAMVGILADGAAMKLRSQNAVCKTVGVNFRTTDLNYIQRQIRLDSYTDISSVITKAAYDIYKQSFPEPHIFRSLTVRLSDLVPKSRVYSQTDLFGFEENLTRAGQLDCAVDEIRNKFGTDSVIRGSALCLNCQNIGRKIP